MESDVGGKEAGGKEEEGGRGRGKGIKKDQPRNTFRIAFAPVFFNVGLYRVFFCRMLYFQLNRSGGDMN